MKEKLEKKTLGRNQIKLRKFWNSIGNNLLKGKDKNDYEYTSKKMTIKIKSQRKIYSILFIKRKSITWWRYLIQKKKSTKASYVIMYGLFRII